MSETSSASRSVFISYRHTDDIKPKVRDLRDFLITNGINVISDFDHELVAPELGWPTWMQHSIEDCGLVLVVCTDEYKKLCEKREIKSQGGAGVTWEGAIINQHLYNSKLRNKRFIPIRPDGGCITHIPTLLEAFNNGHTFPSDNETILAAIHHVLPKSTATNTVPTKLLPGELTENNDRLTAQEATFIGREDELAQVINFLKGDEATAAVCGQVAGVGGIGKTELCKAAIKQFLASDTDSVKPRIFWVALNDQVDAKQLILALGNAVGLATETVGQMQSITEIQPLLPHGIYYLDNLESVSQAEHGEQMLNQLKHTPNIRLLASSRVHLPLIFADTINIDEMPLQQAQQLFLQAWNGKPLTESEHNQLTSFLSENLGGHPLAISLLARLGRTCSLTKMINRWQKFGTVLASQQQGNDRTTSLNASFALTLEQLHTQNPLAIQLWCFCSVFVGTIPEDAVSYWEERIVDRDENQISDPQQALNAVRLLCDYHLLQHHNDDINGYTMLPTITRYVQSQLTSNSAFHWPQVQQYLLGYFLMVSEVASAIQSTPENINARVTSSQLMPTLAYFAQQPDVQSDTNYVSFVQLIRQLHNVFNFNVSFSITFLKALNPQFISGIVCEKLGDLERHLGQLDTAKQHYNTAIQLFTDIQDNLGLANALVELGDLERHLGQLDTAKQHYNTAIQLFKQEQSNLGLANALQSIGDLCMENGDIEEAKKQYNQARELYAQEQDPMGLAYTLSELIKLCKLEHPEMSQPDDALVIAALDAAIRSNVTSVQGYVGQAIVSFFDGDTETAQKYVENLLANSQ